METKKAWNPRIETAFDRAKSEQHSLLVALTNSDKRMKNWEVLAGQLSPAIASFAERLSSLCENSVQNVKEKADSLRGLMESLSQAEDVRIALPQSNSGATSPLDAICRGYFGDDVADLMNRLRCCRDDLARLVNSLQLMQKQLLKGITAEVITLVGCSEAMASLE